ncbi:MAG TPA: OmpA family protein [Candidatus Competibacteraceae bacterium]|nr:OmpA family protein [Gammaproteobacteria bacterium]HPF57907.1 OmpA family protein [Candidatus Competibacteraceae bacterium]
MNLSRLATIGLLTLVFLMIGSITTDVIARQQPGSGYEDADNGPGSDDLGGAQQEFERMITPEYRRMGMRVEPLPDGSLRLRLPSEVMFAYDSASINPGFVPTLREIARFMERRRGIRARIVGHTDNKGSESYNLDLSLRRAESVAMFLSTQGVQNRRLTTQGRGEQDPIASNATPEGRQMNRRVDIVLFRRARGDQPKRN